MTKKGFTLIEMLLVIIILSMIAVVSITAITKVLENSQEEAYNLLLDDVKRATKDYLNDNSYLLEEINNSTPDLTIELGDLIGVNYIKSPVIDPRTNKTISESSTIVVHLSETGDLSYTVNLVAE